MQLRLTWSPILRGTDPLGDRSATMAPLRDPVWLEIHPFDARRLGLNDNEVVAVEGEGVAASGRVRVDINASPGFVHAPQNWAILHFAAPPAALPKVTIRGKRESA